tara:strand:+ start:165 stop:776 length:612 start_codon:yes stop_codon:yes gene_type:complete
MTTSYQDDAHDPVTGKYIKPEDRVKAEVDNFTITTEDDTPPVYNVPTEYNPDLDPRVHPELAVGAADTVTVFGGGEDITIGIDTSANVVITEDTNIDYSVDYDPNFDHINLTDPYAAAVDYSVAGMSTASYNPASHEHQHEIKETLDRILDQQVHLQHHVHELMIKVDQVSHKVEHLLEHAHQPLTGTVQIDCPTKVGAGYTV